MHLRDGGHTLAEIVSKTGITRTTLYRHLPPRPAPLLTAAPANKDVDRGHDAEEAPPAVVPAARPTPLPFAADGPAGRSVAPPRSLREAEALLEAVDWPQTYRPACPVCAEPVAGLRERYVRRPGVREPVVVALAQPCGCPVDEHAGALQVAAPAEDGPRPGLPA